MGLYDRLIEYAGGRDYPMCMPGHKRNPRFQMVNPYSIDITEIDGFDNLHDPSELIQEAQETASYLYSSTDSFFLVNGSTAGILAGISSATLPGDTILIARNSHRAVYHAVFLRQLKTEYIYPEPDEKTGIGGSITLEAVRTAIEANRNAKLIVITSPTYEGVVSDIRSIAELAHQHNIMLLVDGAHGAHLGFHKFFPENAAACGADIVIQSLHKTLPAFTQTAVMHRNGDLAQKEKIQYFLSIYQSSSPSYVLMAGIELCLKYLKKEATEEFSVYAKRLVQFYNEAEALSYLYLWQPERGQTVFARDPSKLVIVIKDGVVLHKQISTRAKEQKKVQAFTGRLLYDILRVEYHIQPEMAAAQYVLCMTSLCDTVEGLNRLSDALKLIDDSLCLEETKKNDWSKLQKGYFTKPACYCMPHETENKMKQRTLLSESGGSVCGEYVSLYPPGIPLLVPGEVIPLDFPGLLEKWENAGLHLTGLADKTHQYISTISV